MKTTITLLIALSLTGLSFSQLDTIQLNFENTTGALVGETAELGVAVCKITEVHGWDNCNPYTDSTTYFDGEKGWALEFVVPEEYENYRFQVGLSKDSASQNGINDIEYAMYLTAPNGVLDVYESGARADGFLQHQNVVQYMPGRTYKISYDGDSVKYFYNDTLIHTSTNVPVGNYKLKISMYYSYPCISNVVLTTFGLKSEALEALDFLNGSNFTTDQEYNTIRQRILNE